MADQGNGTGQAPGPDTTQQGQAPAGSTTAPGTQGQAPTGTQTPSPFDPATIQDPAVKAYLETQASETARARADAARYRTERNSSRDQVVAYRTEHETAEQAAARQATEDQAEREALKAENRDLKVGTAILAAADAAKAFDSAVVKGLIDSRITVDAAGKPTNTAALIAELQQTHAFLFRRTGADAGAGNGTGNDPGAGAGMNDFIRGRGRSASR